MALYTVVQRRVRDCTTPPGRLQPLSGAVGDSEGGVNRNPVPIAHNKCEPEGDAEHLQGANNRTKPKGSEQGAARLQVSVGAY